MLDLQSGYQPKINRYEIKIVELEEKIKEMENKEIKEKDNNENEENEENEMLNQQIEELNKSLEGWKNKKEKLEIKCSNLTQEVSKLNELIALNQEDTFSKYLAFGLIFQLIVQVIMNLSVVIGLIPVTGVTLPFISYGGSSLLTSLVGIGILLNISKSSN